MLNLSTLLNQKIKEFPEDDKPAPSDSVLKSFIINFFTAGIYATSQSMEKLEKIRKLTKQQKNILDQYQKGMGNLQNIETELSKQLIQIIQSKEVGNDEIDNLEKILKEKESKFSSKLNDVQTKFPSTYTEICLDIISFIGNLLSNIFTLGIYGPYRNYYLQKKITLLESQTSSLTKGVEAVKDDFIKDKLKPLLEASLSTLSKQKLFNIFKNSPDGKAAVSFKEESDKKLANFQVQLNATKAEKKSLQDEIAKLKASSGNQPEIVKLSTQLGPLPLKYTPEKCPGAILGAVDLVKSKKEKKEEATLPAHAVAYDKRYGEWLSATDICLQGFDYAFLSLKAGAQKPGNPINFHNSKDMYLTPGHMAIYRKMVLDILKGAGVVENGCHGYKLTINKHVDMLPTLTEKILQNKNNSEVVSLHFQQRDDFTPSEELALQNGMGGTDPVSAKWILNDLSAEEHTYLYLILMRPLIEKTNPVYQKMMTFMSDKANPKVKLIQTAADLIENIAFSMKLKFNAAILDQYWEKQKFDDVKPFMTKEDFEADKEIQKLLNQDPNGDIVWKIDNQVINGGGKYPAPNVNQMKFGKLVKTMKDHYQNVLPILGEAKLLENPPKVGQIFKSVTFDLISKYFHVSHEMIGQNESTQKGGARCLFSNLLAIICLDQKDLIHEPEKNEQGMKNVEALRKAMANYIMKCQDVLSKWEKEKENFSKIDSLPDDEKEDLIELKNFADIAEKLRVEIKNTHKCSLEEYQNWLRTAKQPKSKAIDLEHLTPLEIQVAAYTLGVRIGLISIKSEHAPCKVDEMGRIIPGPENIFGPDTKEVLLMAYNAPSSSFYGLYPKMNAGMSDNLYSGKYTEETINSVMQVQGYWYGVDMSVKLKEPIPDF